MSGPGAPTPLSEAQTRQFIDDGYVVLRGAIPDAVVRSTRDALLGALDMRVDDPSTWKRDQGVMFDHFGPTADCMTPAIVDAAEQVVGPGFRRGKIYSPYRAAQGRDPWMAGYIPVLNYPTPGPRVFERPTGHHVDGMQVTTLWPRELYLVVFAYLTDTPEYGGATALWPGAHRTYFRHWLAQGTRPDGTIPDITPELQEKLGEPIPFVGSAGDVILMHYLMPHNGSANHGDWVRMGLNTGIQPETDQPYVRKIGAPDASWTPLDWTLSDVS